MIHDFSVWLGTVSNPADINQFQSHTGKNLPAIFLSFTLAPWLIRIFTIAKCPSQAVTMNGVHPL